MAEESSLKLYWEHFFKAETGTYEKSRWLDLFLAEFICRLNDGADPKELVSFCRVSGVVSLVGCELLCGIHRVTMCRHTGGQVFHTDSPPLAAIPPDPEVAERPAPSLLTRINAQPASEVLRQYLLAGLPWRCLVLLRALGVEGLSCCRQLSSVLIWLWGELTASSDQPANKEPRTKRSSTAPMHQLFSRRIWSSNKHCGSLTQSPAHTSERSSVTGRSRQSNYSESKSKRKHVKQSDVSSDSGDSNGDLQSLNRSLTIKVNSPRDDFHYFDSPLNTPKDYNDTLYSDPFRTPKKPKPKADDYINDRHKAIINTQINNFEFTSLIIDLLQELCKTESSLSGSEGSQISVQCINFSLKNLCSLQFGSISQVHYDNEDISTIKVMLTELLIVSLDKVLVHSDLCAKLINNGILPMLLRVLEDVICKSSSKYSDNRSRDKKDPEKLSKTEAENLLRFVFGIGYCITAFFHCLLMQCRTIEKLREFTDQFKLYGECLKGGLLKECVELMVRIPNVDENEVVVLVKKFIESLGKLINGMKSVRSEVVHTAACTKSRHKLCRQRVIAGMHHHHDILGEAGTGLPMASACCISVLYGTLTSLVCDEEVSSKAALRGKILRVMLKSGACCCFSPGFLMESVVRLMLTHSSVAAQCLQLLEHTIYGELGASVLMSKMTDQLPCSVCEPSEDKRELVRKYCPHGVSPVDRKSVWSFLIHYNSLLQLDNHNNVLHATVSHLLRVTPKCRTEMKYELLFSVIYPTFIVAKHRYILRMEQSAYFLTVSCLNIFASLLNTVSFAEQFIQKGGLSYVLELVSLNEFSNQCCSILEIAIVVEIYKLIKENADITFYKEINSLPSVQMLFKSLSDMTDKCYKIYKLKLPEDKYEELCDVSKEREKLAIVDLKMESNKLSVPKMKLPVTYAFSENTKEDCIEDFVESLKHIQTFWKSCASLCLYSPMFRQFVVSERVFVDSYALLKMLLYYLCHCHSGSEEMRVGIKILEALLTVQFATADVTSGRSKTTSCSVIRESLQVGGGALAAQGGTGLRALCEALIRVCVASPSATHVMPRPNHAKVPPLECASSDSSVDCSCSSSEDSSRMSDHNAAVRSDGYEADVEIGKLEILAALQNNKMSASMSTVNSNTSGYHSPQEAIECPEYVKDGGLAHPELCVIVVDILAQLIDKVMSSKSSVEQQSLAEDAGTGLARACCTRLAAALNGACPPAGLLTRLLQGATQLLVRPEPELNELQCSVLELIVVVASRRIEASELAALLRPLATAILDTHRNEDILHHNGHEANGHHKASASPPLTKTILPKPGPTLQCLHRLALTAEPLTPDHILTFPTHVPTDETMSAEDLNYVVVSNATSSQSQQAEGRAKVLHDAHTRAGISSPWSKGAVRCGIEGAGWAPWLQGFAVTAWLQCAPSARRANGGQWDSWESWHSEASTSPSQSGAGTNSPGAGPQPSQPLHLLSVGHASLMFEIWIDINTGQLTLKLSRPETNTNKVVSVGQAGGPAPHQWSCVAVNVRETVHKRRAHIQVTVYVNGCETDTISLPVQGILVRKVMPVHLIIGHLSSPADTDGAYHLSNVSVLRAPVLCAPIVLHIAAHGPDHQCQVRCDAPNFSPLLTPAVIESGIDWEQVFELSSNTLRDLHDNWLVTFDAHSPTIMNLYHQTAAMPTTAVFTGRMGPVGPTAGGGGASIPETLFPTWAGWMRCARHRGLPTAVYMLGGPTQMLYLYARVVELEASAEEQAMALSILLRVCKVDSRLYAMLHADDMFDMLHTVLAAPACRVSPHMLKAILDVACSSPVLSVCGGSAVVAARTDAVLLEPRLLALLTKAWRQLHTAKEVSWEVESASGGRAPQRGSLWALALVCMSSMVRADYHHSRTAFNHYQMTRVQLMRHLLTACKEQFLNSDCGPLDPDASTALVELVQGLMGAPPLLDRLALLGDFLLLMHQASDTFVTHSRANFYFLLTPDTPETSDYRRDSFTKRASTRRLRKNMQRDADAVSSSSVTSEDVNEMALDDRLEGSSVDSKHSKGLINATIRMGRKHNVSSTSENSDIFNDKPECISERLEADSDVPEGGEEGEQETDTARTHHSDDIYGQGVYQRRVLAGAEPGWSACEGLLRLLRDTLAALPDHDLTQAVCGAIQPETLVVVGNHAASGVRAAVVRAVGAIQRRANSDLCKRLRANHYYLHLANQISLYPGSWDLATACAELVTKCDVPLQDQLDDDIWMDLSEEAGVRCPPLLALLPGSLSDVPLHHNITLLLRRVIDKSSMKVLSEVGVAEVVVRCIGLLGAMQAREGTSLLLQDLQDLLHCLAAKAQPTAHQTIVDIHHMLSYSEQTAADLGTAQALRNAQLAYYCYQLDHLEERLQASYAAHTKYANYFTTVLSSAVSLGSEAGARSERSELAARHLSTVSRAVSYLTAPAVYRAAGSEGMLMERLLHTLLAAVMGSAPARPKWWAGGADWAGPLLDLFWWAVSPSPHARPLQGALLRALYHAPPTAIAVLQPADPAHMRKLAVYLLTLLKNIHAAGEEDGAPAVELAITDWARTWAVNMQAGLAERLSSHCLPEEAARLLAHDDDKWTKAALKQRPLIAKTVFAKDALANKLTESAMGITRQVVDIQNTERKAFMEHLRRAHSQAVAATQRWQRLVDQLTHEQAVWHDPLSYPQSWQLDATEGPGRVRVRLRRAHLGIPARFLQPAQRHKAESIHRPSPLKSVVGGGSGLRGGLVARLQLNETVSYMARVTYVTVHSETTGELLLSDRSIHFVPEDCEAMEKHRSPAQSWHLEAVVQVATRRWCLQERAAELFLSSGHAHLVAFADVNERTAFLKALDKCHLPNRTEPDTLAEATNQWRSGTITNWEYLMRLNGLAGRTYNDLMQYPVLPFVIADYSSRILDLTDPGSFRDLSRPMAIQNKQREQHYINTYNDLKVARREGCSPLLSRQPHHYASLYSNSGGVLHYLVRLPPFTELFLNYQDNNFDMPDRTFHSLATTWRLITKDSPTDVKELIPELFYLPELFHNNEGLNLGIRQCGAAIDDVELPPWAADARLFTLVHRQALEAPAATDALPHWIDLVFGYKQTGQAAIDAINVFPACTYYGFDPTALDDEVDRTAAAAMVRTYGQAPRQLLKVPHPQRQADLTASTPQPQAYGGVVGVSWGRYCGSPALGAPCVGARRAVVGAAAVIALPHRRSAAIAQRNTTVVPLTGGGGVGSSFGELGVLSWGHSDHVVRLKRRKDQPPALLYRLSPNYQITVVASSCVGGCPGPMILGLSSGTVVALRLRHDPLAAGGTALPPRAAFRLLHAHHAAVTALCVCVKAGLLATASHDGKIVLWDLNKLSYIRTLPNRDMLSVSHVTISETLCDVASVHEPARSGNVADNHDSDSYEKDHTYKYQSLIRVHTVNARYVGSVKVAELVTCICYSGAPEGVSVNVIAAGTDTGCVRLYSAWELRPCGLIQPPLHTPLLSVTYSSDSSLLFGCYADGTCVAWESDTGARTSPPRLLPAHALL